MSLCARHNELALASMLHMSAYTGINWDWIWGTTACLTCSIQLLATRKNLYCTIVMILSWGVMAKKTIAPVLNDIRLRGIFHAERIMTFRVVPSTFPARPKNGVDTNIDSGSCHKLNDPNYSNPQLCKLLTEAMGMGAWHTVSNSNSWKGDVDEAGESGGSRIYTCTCVWSK